jgi:FtsP/CotA-like multicopper oxidase with cupredoxin domain
VTLHLSNEVDVETTVRWHGLRVDNRSDGVPCHIAERLEGPG